MPLNLTHLAAFHAVAAHLSFSRAAERSMVSQPALSKQVRQLEAALNVILFNRTPRGVALTEAGELLHDHAARLFAVRDQAEDAILQLRGVKRGRLNIGASTTIAVYLLPDLIVAFRRQFPSIHVQLDIGNTSHIHAALLDHSLDVGLTESPVDDPRFQSQILLHDRLIPIASRRHELAKKRTLTLATLARQPFIVRQGAGGGKSLVERILAERHVRIQPTLSLANTEAIKSAVAAGLGVAIVSALSVELEIKARRLIALPVRDLQIQRPLHLLRLRSSHASPALGAFLDVMTRELQRRRIQL